MMRLKSLAGGFWVCGWLCVTAMTARAEDGPLIRPDRDVEIIYAMAPANRPGLIEQRMRWDVSEKKLRIDLPTPGVYMIVDFNTRQTNVVRNADHQVLVLPDEGAALPGETPGHSFIRRGEDEVAGIPCVDWETFDNNVQPVVVCVTSGGLLLRAISGDRVILQARMISVGPQDHKVFVLPKGYEYMHPQQAQTPSAQAAPQAAGGH